ncbi:nitroreductase family protein [Nocardia sp. NPDC004722]
MNEAIQALRSVRHFRSDAVPVATVEAIVDVARWTGSARNRQPWRFVAVTDPATRRTLAGLGGYAVHLAAAPLVLILASAENGFADTEFDMGRIAQSLCLAAAGHGLGSCLTTFHPVENVRRAAAAVALPPGWTPRHAIALGYPDLANQAAPTAIPCGRLPVSELLSWRG